MIYKDRKEISGIFVSGKVITAVYKGAVLVWEAINSCFGAGYWRGDKPWIGKDAWKG